MGWTIPSTVPFPMLEHGETVRRLSRFGVGPEIYFSGTTLDRLTPEAAGAVAESLRSAGIATTTFHAPFNDISPGARDEEVRRVTVRRLRQAVSLAPLFLPLGIVMHGGYSDWLFDFDEVPDHLLCLRAAVGSRRLGFCARLGEPFQGSVEEPEDFPAGESVSFLGEERDFPALAVQFLPENAEKNARDLRVEMVIDVIADLRDRVRQGQALPVRTVGHHCVERVGDGDDARNDGDLVIPLGVRIAAPVHPLLMVSRQQGDVRVREPDLRENVVARLRVLL